ncbi:MAG: hypothetical protein RBS80_17125 [Thermoguttaceae bacterium]|nr:hypothetical protein [Thermoguttaceae bacterium]
MKRQWTRYALVALFACLLGVLAHASISRAVQGRDPEPARGRAARQDDDRRNDKKPQNALLRELWELIDQATDLSSDEKSEAFEILEEADPILTRIKKENEKAIEILKNPPRMVVPKPPAKEDKNAEEKPEPKESPAPEETPAPEEPGQDAQTGA